MKKIFISLVAGFVAVSLLGVTEAQDEIVEALRFPNAQVTDILDIYEKMSRKTLIRGANLVGPTISVVSAEAMTQEQALRFIEASLLLNGFTLVPGPDNTVKVINAAGGSNPRSEAVPLHSSLETLPAGDELVSYFMPLRHINPEEAAGILTAHVPLHSYGSVVPVGGAQALLISENTPVIRKMVALQPLIDVPPARVESVFVQLERADAERVATIIQTLLGERQQQAQSSQPQQPAIELEGLPEEVQQAFTDGALANPVASQPTERALIAGEARIVPDPRTNRILLITRPANLAYLRSLILQFDQAVPLESPFERPLNHISALGVLPVLESLLSEEQQEGQQARQPTQTPTQTGQEVALGSDADLRLEGNTGDVDPVSVAVGRTRLIADPKANSILVSGSPEAVNKVRLVLDKLDQRPKQVYLSVIIGQLSVGENQEFGIDVLQKFGISDGGSGVASSFSSIADQIILEPQSLVTTDSFPSPLPAGLRVYGLLNDEINVFVKMLEGTDRFRILSRPSVFTTNNKPALISSGQRVPVPSQSVSTVNPGTNIDGNVAVSSTLQFENVELQLVVLPLINARNEVTLQVAQKNDSIAGSATISGNTVPIIASQKINTTVTVPNGSTVMLGGLVTESIERSRSGLPIIGRIPLIGYLTSRTVTNEVANELIILIQPVVIDGDMSEERYTMEYLRQTPFAEVLNVPPEEVPYQAMEVLPVASDKSFDSGGESRARPGNPLR